MLHYFIQTIAFQLLFLLIYDAFLKKETFFNYNRAYLLISAVLSLILPFIKIDRFKEILPKEYAFELPEVFIGKTKETTLDLTITTETVNTAVNIFSWSNIFYLGCIAALVIFIYKISKILILVYKNPKYKHNNFFIVELKNSSLAFSFFNYIFLGDNIEFKEKAAIIAHEQVHVSQKHTLDLLFFEILRIFFWFNPLIYFYQKKLSNIHEFIADAEAIKHDTKKTYYESLLSQVFDTRTVSFINPFFKESLIKKRIIMLSKNKSKQISLFKYALLLPVIVGILVYTSCESPLANSSDTELKEVSSNINEQELLQKYIKELQAMEAEGLSGSEKLKRYSEFTETDSYIQTEDKFLRSKALDYVQALAILNGNFKGSDEHRANFKNRIEKFLNKSYEDYLEEKKTPQAIKDWENSAKSFQIRKYVKDLDNISAAEQQNIDAHSNLIKTDEYYNTLIVSDGLKHNKTEFKNKIDETDLGVDDAISFDMIEDVPTFTECEGLTDLKEKKDCFSTTINKLVVRNFDLELGKTLGLSGKLKISAFFTITTTGDIANIKVRAPHPGLERETLRVIKLIPKPNPGMKDGKPVNVVFFLPITFNIEK